MRLGKMAAATAALAMVATPALAAPRPAAKGEPVRAATKLKKSSKAVGAVVAVPAVALAGLGIAAAAGAFSDDDSDSR
jgi:hypothetical protein